MSVITGLPVKGYGLAQFNHGPVAQLVDYQITMWESTVKIVVGPALGVLK